MDGATPGRADVRKGGGSLLVPLANGLPDFALAAMFFLTWSRPCYLFTNALRNMVAVVQMEFVIILASGVLENVVFSRTRRSRRLVYFLASAGFYSVIAAGLSIGWGSLLSFAIFWGLVLNRYFLLLVRSGRGGEELKLAATRRDWQTIWTASLVLFLALGYITSALPVSARGITPDVVALQGFGPGDFGPWARQPQQAMAIGSWYFSLLAVVEVVVATRASWAAGDGSRGPASEDRSKPGSR